MGIPELAQRVRGKLGPEWALGHPFLTVHSHDDATFWIARVRAVGRNEYASGAGMTADVAVDELLASIDQTTVEGS